MSPINSKQVKEIWTVSSPQVPTYQFLSVDLRDEGPEFNIFLRDPVAGQVYERNQNHLIIKGQLLLTDNIVGPDLLGLLGPDPVGLK